MGLVCGQYGKYYLSEGVLPSCCAASFAEETLLLAGTYNERPLFYLILILVVNSVH